MSEEHRVNQYRDWIEKENDNILEIVDHDREKLKQQGFMDTKTYAGLTLSKGSSRNIRYVREQINESEEQIKKVSEEAFEKADNGEVKEAIEKLKELKGVSVAVASAFLSAYNCEKFPIIDQWAIKELNDHFDWDDNGNLVYEEDGNGPNLTPKRYVAYKEKMNEIADRHGLTPRKLDFGMYLVNARWTDENWREEIGL
jgi:thermostable 8-oxoguanine DNA glycosylase